MLPGGRVRCSSWRVGAGSGPVRPVNSSGPIPKPSELPDSASAKSSTRASTPYSAVSSSKVVCDSATASGTALVVASPESTRKTSASAPGGGSMVAPSSSDTGKSGSGSSAG